MPVAPPLRYIHIDDYSPVGYQNGPDDLAFANARADLAAYGYHTLILGQSQYWLENDFNLNAFTDVFGVAQPALYNARPLHHRRQRGCNRRCKQPAATQRDLFLLPGLPFGIQKQ